MRTLVPSLAALSLLAAACGADSGADVPAADGDPTAGDVTSGDVTAAAAVYPLAWLAEEIAPDARVEFLGAGSQEAHGLELTPGQRASVESSDVLLYLGDIGYQPQIEDAADAAAGEVVDVSAVAGPDRMLAVDDAHAHEDAHGEGEDGHAAEDLDPHVWFDASIMADVAVAVGEAFAAVDPDNASTYTANAERVREELLGVSEEVGQVLGQDCRFDEAIVSHAAYGYLLEPFGSGQHAVVGVASGEAGASSAELAELAAEIEAEGFTHVLAEPVEGRADAEAVASETGAELLDVYPLDVVDDEQARQGYPDLLRQQADTFATALGCG